MTPKTCDDYTDDDRHNDYVRHTREGTRPCAPSKRAWAIRQRAVRARLRKRDA
jgi:hypothetical protein